MSEKSLFTSTRAAHAVGVALCTLYLWERKELFIAQRVGNRRVYSHDDLVALRELKRSIRRGPKPKGTK